MRTRSIWRGVDSGPSRRTRFIVSLVWAVSVALAMFGFVNVPAGTFNLPIIQLAGQLVLAIVSFASQVAIPSVGALLVLRLPGNRVGWLLLVGGGLVGGLDRILPVAALDIGGPSGADWSAWFTQMLFVPYLLSLLVFLPLIFPTGRLPSSRWRPVLDLSWVTLAFATVGVAFAGPFALNGTLNDLLGVVNSILFVFDGMVVLATGALVVRYGRATGVEREQLHWPAVAASIAGLSAVIALLTFVAPGWGGASYDAFVVNNVAVALLAVAIAVAVRRQGPVALESSDTGSAAHRHGRRPIVLVGWTITIALTLLSLVLARPGGADDLLTAITQAAASLALVTAGTILLRRVPGHRIGWLLWAGGLLGVLHGATAGLADDGLTVHPGSIPGAIWLAWLSQWIIVPYVWILALVPLLYPTGRLISERRRSVAIIGTLVAAIISVEAALTSWPAGLFPLDNPFAASDLAGNFAGLVGSSNFLLFIVILTAVVSLVIRYHHAAGIERAQIKWFSAVLAIGGPAIVIGVIAGGSTNTVTVISTLGFIVGEVSFAFLPVAIGIAILRYKLYEIDRLISRTISYGVLTAIVAGLFVGFILVFQAVLAPVTGSNELAVAGSTLLAAALFQPLRRRVQRLVDRRFNRSRYDAEQTVAAFAARLADEVDLDQLRAEILATVTATVEPSSVSLWLRD
jgi:hypothetical protein